MTRSGSPRRTALGIRPGKARNQMLRAHDTLFQGRRQLRREDAAHIAESPGSLDTGLNFSQIFTYHMLPEITQQLHRHPAAACPVCPPASSFRWNSPPDNRSLPPKSSGRTVTIMALLALRLSLAW